MARSRISPAPPRIAEPDLPEELTPAALGRSADILGARITLGAGGTDAAHARVSESVIAPASVETLDLTGAVLSDVVADGLSAAEVIAREGTWRSVVVRGGRIGTLDLSRSRCDGLVLDGVRIDYLTVAGATLGDVEIEGCRIGTLDAPGARIQRMRVTGSTVDECDTREWTISDLDLRGADVLAFTDVRALRGATLSEDQVTMHASAFAVSLGIDVRAADDLSRTTPRL
ncbi:MAG TPA: hypothetical protein DHW40_00795 [Microbacterium sp.]|nr:hypothetical protein [Microbacterium sp.]